MARAFVRTIKTDKFHGYRDHHDTTFGDGRVSSHIEVVCDNGVVITIYPDGTIGRKDWSERQGGAPRIR